MIKCHINKQKSKARLHTTGTAQELMVETAAMIQQIFQGINDQNPEAAQGYKLHLLGTLLDINSPQNRENIHKKGLPNSEDP